MSQRGPAHPRPCRIRSVQVNADTPAGLSHVPVSHDNARQTPRAGVEGGRPESGLTAATTREMALRGGSSVGCRFGEQNSWAWVRGARQRAGGTGGTRRVGNGSHLCPPPPFSGTAGHEPPRALRGDDPWTTPTIRGALRRSRHPLRDRQLRHQRHRRSFDCPERRRAEGRPPRSHRRYSRLSGSFPLLHSCTAAFSSSCTH